MNPRRMVQSLFLSIALGLGLAASAYVAGHLFFLVNKTIPRDIHIDTWYRYWAAYSTHPVQRHRLLVSGAAAPALVIGLPLLLHLKHRRRPRLLHGDARWATTAEIRQAGLL
jgi:type IV secretion system protein VirD4